MGGWEFWILPVIAVAGWIINAILRGEDQRKRPAAPDEARPRRPGGATDLDRFLQEVNRRRREAEERRPDEPTAAPPLPPPPPPRPVPRPAPPRPAAAPPSVALAAVVIPPVPPPVVAAEAVSAYRAPEKVARAPSRPAVPVDVGKLLQSPEGLRAAFVLQEVFGPPLARRRRV